MDRIRKESIRGIAHGWCFGDKRRELDWDGSIMFRGWTEIMLVKRCWGFCCFKYAIISCIKNQQGKEEARLEVMPWNYFCNKTSSPVTQWWTQSLRALKVKDQQLELFSWSNLAHTFMNTNGKSLFSKSPSRSQSCSLLLLGSVFCLTIVMIKKDYNSL